MTPAVPQPQKMLTLAEANATLPRVRSLIEQLQQLQRSITQTTTQSEEMSSKISAGNGYPIQTLKAELKKLSKHQLTLIEAFQSAMAQLEQLGCQLKDLSTGLIDFYTYREGTLVFLCWKLGEDQIRFWHTLDGGYAARQPLDEAR